MHIVLITAPFLNYVVILGKSYLSICIHATNNYCALTSCLGFPGGSEVKASACNTGDLGSVPGLGRSPGEGNGNPLQYSCLKNPMDGEAWWATIHGVAKSWTRLSDFTSLHFYLLFRFSLHWWAKKKVILRSVIVFVDFSIEHSKIIYNYTQYKLYWKYRLFWRHSASAELFRHVHIFAGPWSIAHQSPLPMEFSRQ